MNDGTVIRESYFDYGIKPARKFLTSASLNFYRWLGWESFPNRYVQSPPSQI